MLQLLAASQNGWLDISRGSFSSRSPIAFNSPLSIAPIINAVLADTGPLPAGTYLVFDSGENSANANSLEPILVERNAANSADVATSITLVAFGSGGSYLRESIAQVAQGERLILRASVAAAALEKYQMGIAVFPL